MARTRETPPGTHEARGEPGLLSLVALTSALGVIAMLLALDVVTFAYRRMGVGEAVVVPLLFASIVGSLIDVPIARTRGTRVVSRTAVEAYGRRYLIPTVVHTDTIIAINVGGAIIPSGLAVYLLLRDHQLVRTLVALAIVTIAVHGLARAVPGVGIEVPALAPPMVAAAVALALAGHDAAPIAYIAGTLGTLLGADLLNMGKVRALAAPVASIGGGGTFDGVFLTGVVAVVLVVAL